MTRRRRSWLRRLLHRLHGGDSPPPPADIEREGLLDIELEQAPEPHRGAERLAPPAVSDGAVGDRPAPPAALRAAAPEPPERSAAEQALAGLLADLQAGQADRERAAARVRELVGRLPPEAEQRALELLSRATRLLPAAGELRYELARRLYHRRDLRAALPLLDELAGDPEHAAQAHLLLGDHCRAEADLRTALKHYEAVLGHDFAHPGARARADDLRRRLDRPLGASAPTLLGAAEVTPGSRYSLQRELGRGGGGTVYLAHDRSLGRPVALKVLHPHVARRAEARAHLFCEARIAAALRHPRIVTIYDLDERLNLVAMEYCAGGTLGDRIARGAMEPSRALDLLAQITAALQNVHACGVVHRDLKPGNLLFRRAADEAAPVLSDFGAAHAPVTEDDGDPDVVGSRAYMAPEQRLGSPPDPRADLYACGMLLVEMLLGRRALTDQQALRGELPAELQPLWDELEQACATTGSAAIGLARRLLDPDAARRPATAREVSGTAVTLARSCRRAEDAQQVLRELERRAGPPPRDAAVSAWLAEQREWLVAE